MKFHIHLKSGFNAKTCYLGFPLGALLPATTDKTPTSGEPTSWTFSKYSSDAAISRSTRYACDAECLEWLSLTVNVRSSFGSTPDILFTVTVTDKSGRTTFSRQGNNSSENWSFIDIKITMQSQPLYAVVRLYIPISLSSIKWNTTSLYMIANLFMHNWCTVF